jgi:dolichol-phosphate mannosyltransferase
MAAQRNSRDLGLGMIAAEPVFSGCALSVVVPCFNEQDGLVELHKRLSAVCREASGGDYEIVLVNDGSRDRTWPLMRQLAEADFHVNAVNLSRNYGHQLALTAGLQLARGQRILIIDADLQDPPELLPEMMRRMDEGADVVYGQRQAREGETWAKKATAGVFYRLLERLVDIEIPRDTGDFRLMSRRALNVLNSMPEQHRFIRGMVSWMGLRQVPVYYVRAARFAGTTNYPFRKMVSFAVDAITGFSTGPLRLASYFAAMFGMLGFLLLAYVVFGVLFGHTVVGWASVMSAVILLGSVQLFTLGIIGEYLGRLYVQGKNRPLFVISEIVGGIGGAAAAEDRAPLANMLPTEG